MKTEDLSKIEGLELIGTQFVAHFSSIELEESTKSLVEKMGLAFDSILGELRSIYNSEIPVLPLSVIDSRLSVLRSKVGELNEQREHYAREAEWTIVKSIKEQIAAYNKEIRILESLQQDAILK